MRLFSKLSVIEEYNTIKHLASLSEKAIKKTHIAEERAIYASKCKKSFQYYFRENNGNRSFVKSEDHQSVRKYVQHEYNVKLNKALTRNKHILEKFLEQYDFSGAEGVYERMPEAKRVLVNPIIPSDEQFIEEWKKQFPGGQNTFPEEAIYETENGESVRSKSEKILADLFLKHGIPYSYEPHVSLSNGRTVYPDFALLNLPQRKTVFWEHLGLLSNEDYAAKNFKKICEYEKSGIILGDNLIVSMESESIPLDIKLIEKKLNLFLL